MTNPKNSDGAQFLGAAEDLRDLGGAPPERLRSDLPKGRADLDDV
jgi:hypothetical protein